MEVRLVTAKDARALAEYYSKNSDFLRIWEPLREGGYHSVESWKRRVQEWIKEQSLGCSAYFISYDKSADAIIAICSLTNIVRGPFQACNIGHSISEEHQGKGLMKELCRHVIDHAFNQLNLNRIMANYMPINRRSEDLLRSLEFTREGIAKKYLFINGKWEDHVLTSLINPSNT